MPRLDYFQNDTHVTLTVLIKSPSKEETKVTYSDTAVTIRTVGGVDGEYATNIKLWGMIIPAQCSHLTLTKKIEVKLRKRTGGLWPQYEGNGTGMAQVSMATADQDSHGLPLVGGSHKKSHAEWNSVEKQALEDEANEKPEGEQALQKMFQDLYKDASDETKRAMNKSFQESNGTVLSTNWAEIGNKKTEIQAPEGMDVKKF